MSPGNPTLKQCRAIACTQRTQAGFTLMEVMIASLLLSLVMTAVYTMFHATLLSWRRVERGHDIHREVRNFASLLQREMNNLTPDAAHLFTGEDNELTMFVSSETLDVEESLGRRLMRVRYRFNRTGGEIVREEARVESPLPPLPPDAERPVDRARIKLGREEEFVVAEHVTSFEISYVWIPVPEERRDPNVPPVRMEPVVLEEHQEGWRLGYPNAIRVRVGLVDPDDDGISYVVESVVRIRLQPYRWTLDQLRDRTGGPV